MMPWKILSSSSVMSRKGLPASLFSPDLMMVTLTPTLPISPWMSGKIEMTPMLPVRVVGWAMMKSEAEAT